MTTSDVPGLLTLLGHELRAPAGVVGGYLSLVERHPLTPEQRRALDGARQAQQALIGILDDVRRLLDVWHDGTPVVQRTSLRAVLDRATAHCGELTVTPCGPHRPAPDLHVAGHRDALADAFAAFAAAVAREHGTAVECVVIPAGDRIARLVFVPRGGTAGAEHARTTFNERRPGLGLRLVVAAEHVRRAGGDVHDLIDHGRSSGIEVHLPVSPPSSDEQPAGAAPR